SDRMVRLIVDLQPCKWCFSQASVAYCFQYFKVFPVSVHRDKRAHPVTATHACAGLLVGLVVCYLLGVHFRYLSCPSASQCLSVLFGHSLLSLICFVFVILNYLPLFD